MTHSRRSFLIGVPVVAAAAVVATSTPAMATPAHQSPIAIRSRSAVDDPKLPALVVDYPDHVKLHVHYVRHDMNNPAGCTIRGPEETIQADVPADTAAIHLAGARYELLQFHFHTRSEHVLDGHHYSLEQHYVHRGPQGQTLVIALFLTHGGRGGTPQDAVLHTLPQECGTDRDITVNLKNSLPADLSTFRYTGSLTTAPYTEGVSWLILRQHHAVTDATVHGFEDLFPKGNARKLQPLNNRTVRYRRQR
ncbi:carbonic anhydrase family protein [Pseudonocardia sp. CA-142604]|uniref:carbonic anhydrase family protein n=1 Tax=Pseudonocardia sp. CA-142604 TaxID=3240024 RepID=UPI003D8B8075